MAVFTKDDFDALLSPSSRPCISILMPAFEKGKDIRQNTIRFKNLVGRVREHLEGLGAEDGQAVQSMLPRLEALNEDPAFDRDQGKGLAVFADSDALRTFRLPVTVPERVVVAEHFHLKPLMPLALEDERFYLLAITQGKVSLYRCSRQSIEPVDVPGMPDGLDDTLKFDEIQRQFQFYTGAPPAKGNVRAGVFHGQNVVDEPENERLRRYCQDIDRAVSAALKQESAPLMTAALGFLHPLYRDVNTYPHLIDGGIDKNPEAFDLTDLHALAWRQLAPGREQQIDQAVEDYNNVKGTGKTGDDLETVVRAAVRGRIDTLLFDADTDLWGRVDPDKDIVEQHDSQQPGDQELIDTAARHTLKNGGTVFPLTKARMPDGTGVAALFRY